ncbi:MAG: glycosyltransferase family 1 protein [Mycobacteriales bacterium]
MARIVQVANFFGPRSGGLRTTLKALARGYAAAGHEVVQVVPGQVDQVLYPPWGRRVVLRGTPVANTGYRVLSARAAREAVQASQPDRLEVHDRTTLRSLGGWAARHGVPAMVVSHERLDRWLRQWLPGSLPLDLLADRSNRALADAFDAVVCTTRWAAQEFQRLPTPHLVQIPLGVDLELFHPDQASAALRSAVGCPGEGLVLLASRLSREKRPDLAVEAVRQLAATRPVRLLVAGAGPLQPALARQAAGAPVDLLGFLPDRIQLARLMATVDVVVAPGPVETFGLAALESLSSGTPVAAARSSALGEVLGAAGALADGTAPSCAAAIEDLLDRPADARRAAARTQAELFPWSATVAGFLSVHRLPPAAGQPAAA